MTATVILVDAAPRRAVDGAGAPVRLAGGGAAVPYYYGGQHYRAGIVGLPKTIAALDFDGEQLGGGGVGQALELRWAPARAAALAELADLFWTDAPITIRMGPEGPALPPVANSGLVSDSGVDEGTLRIVLSDGTADLKRQLLTDRFAGTGGIEGPAEWEGRIKSRAWGRCLNVPGQVILPASNIICFGDPRRAWQAFDQVRNRGVAIEMSSVLDWQGSAEATFAALIAIVVPAGTAVFCPSIACVKWWTSPDGDVHADIRGEIAGGYVETAPAIAARIVAARSTLTVNASELADASAARPAPFGWRVGAESATAASEISELLAGVSLSWLVVDGQVGFRRWEWGASRRAARSQGVTRRQVYKPVATRKLGYRRNWSPLARGDLAAIVLARDVVYDDGSSLAEAIAEATQTAVQASSDSWLDPSEKRQAKIDYDQRTAQRDALQAKYVALGSPATVTAARDAAFARTQDLFAYLQGLAPSWLDYSVASQVPNPAAYQAAWTASSDALEAFGAAITGLKGDPGQSAYALINDNESHTLTADAAGNITSYAGASFTVTILYGTQDVTASFALEAVDNPQGLAGPSAYPTFGVNGGYDAGEENASATYRFLGKAGTPHAGVRLSTVFSLSKSKAGAGGAGGAAAPLVRVSATPQALRYDKDNNYVAGDVVFTAALTNATGPISWSSVVGHQLYGFPDDVVSFTANTMTIRAGRMGDVLNYNESIGQRAQETIIASASGVQDRVTVTKVRDGSTGNPGAPGADGYALQADHTEFNVPAFANGSIKPTYPGGTGTVSLNRGGFTQTIAVTYALASNSNVTGVAINGRSFSFTGVTGERGSFVIRATFNGNSYDVRIDVQKTYDGSAAFQATTSYNGDSGIGQVTVPAGRTVRVSGNADYYPQNGYGGRTGGLALYVRNLTDNGPDVLVANGSGSQASRFPNENPDEADVEQNGTVSASGTFTSADPDKLYAYRAAFTSSGSSGLSLAVNGSIKLEVL